MKTLYIHGLDSFPRPKKLKILEQAGLIVHALHIDYRNQYHAYNLLYEYATKNKIEFIVGSSLGGLLGYYLSKQLGIKCLLFNPALIFKSIELHIPQLKEDNCKARYIVLGAKDPIINPVKNLNFLEKNNNKDTVQKIITCNWLEHSIDFITFSETVNWAVNNISLSKI